MKDKICPVLVDGKECGLPLTKSTGIRKWESMNVLAVITPIFGENGRHSAQAYKQRFFSFAAIVPLLKSAVSICPTLCKVFTLSHRHDQSLNLSLCFSGRVSREIARYSIHRPAN
jgi:hypothetical protein